MFQGNLLSSNTSSIGWKSSAWSNSQTVTNHKQSLSVKLTNPENTKIHLNLSIFTVTLKLQTWTEHFAMLALKLYVGIQVCMRTLTTENQRKFFSNE